MPADPATGVTPLADSAARLTEAFGRPVVHGAAGPGWIRCADVDAGFVTRWERDVAAEHVREYGRSHPSAAAGYVLGWYAGIPAGLGGALFRLDRRVPRLHRSAVAFRLAPEAYPEASALLDARFWCLPDDPGAGHPDATVVADEAALAAVLRAEVRGHADAFLETYPAHGRLPAGPCSARSPTASTPACGSAATPRPTGCRPRRRSSFPRDRHRCSRRRSQCLSTAAGAGTSTGGSCRAATTSRSTRPPGPAARARGSRPPSGCGS